ncbi:MAG: hypothetical protein GY827_06400 [Cytophagales bacterium]|nr:hypothetical protein [Cytophagales bacterium]
MDTLTKSIQKYDDRGNAIFSEEKVRGGMHHPYYYYGWPVLNIRYLRKYDEWNNQTEQIYQVYFKEKWLNYLKESKEYINDSLLTYLANFYWDEETSKWLPQKKYFAKYSNNILQQEIKEEYTHHTHLPDNQTIIKYKNGQKVNEQEYILRSSSDLELLKSTKYKYSSQPAIDHYFVKQKSVTFHRFLFLKIKDHTYKATFDQNQKILFDENVYYAKSRFSPPKDKSIRYHSEDSTYLAIYKKEKSDKEYQIIHEETTSKKRIQDTTIITTYRSEKGILEKQREEYTIGTYYKYHFDFKIYYSKGKPLPRNLRDSTITIQKGDTTIIIHQKRKNIDKPWHNSSKEEIVEYEKNDTLHRFIREYRYLPNNEEEITDYMLYKYVGEKLIQEIILYVPANFWVEKRGWYEANSMRVRTYQYKKIDFKVSNNLLNWSDYKVFGSDTFARGITTEMVNKDRVFMWAESESYEVDEQGRIIEKKKAKIGHSTTKISTTKFEYNTHNQRVKITIYHNDILEETCNITYHNETSFSKKRVFCISKDEKSEHIYDLWGNELEGSSYKLLDSGEEKLIYHRYGYYTKLQE